MRSSRLYVYNSIVRFLPAPRMWALKRALLRWAGATIGEDVRVISTVRVQLKGRLVVGNASVIGHEALIAGGDADVIIGKHVDIPPRGLIVTGSQFV